jgi:acyl-CoA thioester hydrolase
MTPFVWKSRIRFVDTDASRRIHYTALFRHFEAAEDEFFRALGHPYDMEHSAAVYPRVHVEADYTAALVYDDAVDIEVLVERLGRSSYTLAFRVMKTGAEAARGKITVVCMDPRTQRSREIPADFAALLRGAAGK